MSLSCSQLNSSLARQTPVYDSAFLKDFISDMTTAPYLGRHQTEIWDDGAETRVFDKISVGQPNYTNQWNKRVGADCGMSFPTKNYVAFGTTRDNYFMENQNLFSQLFSLDQLRTIPKLGAQMAEIYRNLRKIPLGFSGDFLRTRMLAYNNTLYVCGNAFNTIALTNANESTMPPFTVDPNASTINLGGSGNLPTSDLTWDYLNYYQQVLGLNGYDMESGLPSGMRSLVTHSRTFQRLVGLNPEIRSQVRLADFESASPLYKIGKGINADPFGSFAPTFDEHQLRYQDAGNGYLERVLPYTNVAATTGLKPQINPDWLNARYGISYIIHPKGSTLFTPKPKKVHEMIPAVNSSMWGAWSYIGGGETNQHSNVLIYPQQDGTTCTIDNSNGWLFFWMCYLELGFKYDQRPLILPILHLIDGAGKACMVDNPICGTAPQYDVQNVSDNPPTCSA